MLRVLKKFQHLRCFSSAALPAPDVSPPILYTGLETQNVDTENIHATVTAVYQQLKAEGLRKKSCICRIKSKIALSRHWAVVD